MNLDIVLDWDCATVKPRAKTRLGDRAKSNIHRFFNRYDGDLGLIKLVILRVGPGAKAQQIIKICPQNGSFSGKTEGVPVMISAEGSLSVTALMTMEGKTVPELQGLLENGPYFSKQKKLDATLRSTVVREVTPPAVTTVTILRAEKVLSGQDLPVVVNKPQVGSGKSQHVVSLPSGSKNASTLLVDLPVEQLDHLKSVLALILFRVIPDLNNVPNTFHLPVVMLSKIMEETDPGRDPSASKRGLFAQFYSSHLRIFAMKLTVEESQDPKSKYGDWLFDGNTIVQFIGGVSNIPALIERFKINISSTATEDSPVVVYEKKSEDNPSVHLVQTPQEVKGGEVNGDVLAAVRAVESKKKAETSLAQARSIEEGLRAELRSLQGQFESLSLQVKQVAESIAQVTISLDTAVDKRKTAQEIVEHTGVLSEDERQQVRTYLLDLASQI